MPDRAAHEYEGLASYRSPHQENVIQVEKVHTIDSWRPEVTTLSLSNEHFDFFMTDSQYITGPEGTTMILYGDTMYGNSVSILASGFHPYFLIKLPEGWTNVEVGQLKNALEEQLALNSYYAKKTHGWLIGDVCTIKGRGLYDYKGDIEETFVKFEVSEPGLVGKCRTILEYPLGRPETLYMSKLDPWWTPEIFPCPVEDMHAEAQKHKGMPIFFEIYEANVDFTLRFQMDHKICATGWVRLDRSKISIASLSNRKTSCQIEINCHHRFVGPSKMDISIVPPIHLLSLDIECLASVKGGFPVARPRVLNPDKSFKMDAYGKEIFSGEPGDPIIQFGFQEVHGNRIKRGIHMIGTTTKVPSADVVYCYPTEKDMLMGIMYHIKKSDPTYLLTYNGDRFDLPYIIDRMRVNGLDALLDFGRLKGREVSYKPGGMKSSAFKVEKSTINVYGRTVIDVCTWFMREIKVRSYTLNSIAQQFLNRTKVEMDHKMIPVLFRGTPKDRCRLAHYCIIDAVLPCELSNAKKIIVNGIQMAAVSRVTVGNLFNRGQQMRIYAQIMQIANNTKSNPDPYGNQQRLDLAYFIPTHHSSKTPPDDKYKGAVVIESQKGLHKEPVATLDFSGLYPSIMQAYNMCYTTSVSWKQVIELCMLESIQYLPMNDFVYTKDKGPVDIPSDDSHIFLVNPDQSHTAIIKRTKIPPTFIVDLKNLREDDPLFEAYGCRVTKGILYNDETTRQLASLGMQEGIHYTKVSSFVKINHVRKGVMPALLESLMYKRKETRAKMEEESDPLLKSIMDGKQLALKLNGNSVYGFTGVKEGSAPYRPIAQSVTLKGRRHILRAKYLVEQKYKRDNGYPFDADVVAGDTDSLFISMTNAVYPLLRTEEDPWVGEAVDPKDTSKKRPLKHTYDMELARDIAIEMAKLVTDDIDRYPMSLEFEKVFITLLISSKKRYAGNKLVSVKCGGKMVFDMYQSKFSATGLECVRRDSCPFVSQTIANVLQMIVMERNLEGAVKYVQDIVSRMKMSDINFSQLVITRGLSRKPEEYTSVLPHVKLAKKMAARDPATAPQVGDRVKYIIVAGLKKDSMADRAEDPFTAFTNGLAIDYEWYLENQLKKPLQRAFCWLETGKHSLKKDSYVIKTLESLIKLSSIDENVFEEDEEDEDDFDISGGFFSSDQDDDLGKDESLTTEVKSSEHKEKGQKRSRSLEPKDYDDDILSAHKVPRTETIEPSINFTSQKRKSTADNFKESFHPPPKQQKQETSVKLWTGHKQGVEQPAKGLGSSRMMESFFGSKRPIDQATYQKKVKKAKKTVTTPGIMRKPKSRKFEGLFSGDHTMTIRSVRNFHNMPCEVLPETPQERPRGKVGMDAHFSSVFTCQACKKAMSLSTRAFCDDCMETHESCESGLDEPCGRCEEKMQTRNQAMKEHLDSLEDGEEKVRKCIEKCEKCVRDNPSRDFLSCRAVDCANLYDRSSAWSIVSKEQFLKSLEW